VRRFKRRISRRQFVAWSRFHLIHPVDGGQKRDHLLALSVIYQARAAGDKLEYDDLMPNPFEGEEDSNPLDPAILAAFAASG
jgi:hypothetical protein